MDYDAAREVASAAAEGEVCDVANDNGAGQVVVSGNKAAVERALEIAKAKGAKRALLLPVSAPFHCALMAPAARVMDQALGTVTLAKPVVPVVANVLAGPISDPAEIHRRLVEQVTSMVRWRESIAWLSGAGVTLFVELGAGKVLSGLAKRIAEGAETLTVGAPDDIDAATARLA
jgi:[acyl-carrier-protein] S-malonyltransferase